MSVRERGSEAVQFAVAAPLFLLMLFSIVQVGGMMLATSQVSSDITRACRQLDVAGLTRAANKEAFVKEAILNTSGQLVADNLHIEDVCARWDQRRSEGLLGGAGPAEQRTSVTTVFYDVCYLIPSILDVVGLSDCELRRQVECACVDDRVIEVNLEAT